MGIRIFTDGGSRGNPGPAAIGGVIFLDQSIVHEFSEYIGVGTNNEAEYQAIKSALQWLNSNNQEDADKIECYLDSKLVVEQLSRNWKIKEPRMKVLADDCWKIVDLISLPVTFHHIPREQNSEADALVNQALDVALK